MSNFRVLRNCNELGHKYLYDAIKQSILDNNPIMIGKIGTIELQIIYQTILISRKMLIDYNLNIKYEAINTAGMHPPNNNTFSIFTSVYLINYLLLEFITSTYYIHHLIMFYLR